MLHKIIGGLLAELLALAVFIRPLSELEDITIAKLKELHALGYASILDKEMSSSKIPGLFRYKLLTTHHGAPVGSVSLTVDDLRGTVDIDGLYPEAPKGYGRALFLMIVHPWRGYRLEMSTEFKEAYRMLESLEPYVDIEVNTLRIDHQIVQRSIAFDVPFLDLSRANEMDPWRK
jgi:hypothetical protein